MKAGKRYLVMKPNESSIYEWDCIEISEHAYKIKNNIKRRSIFLDNGDEPFWILKTAVDTIGQAEYKIIEELK